MVAQHMKVSGCISRWITRSSCEVGVGIHIDRM